MVEEAPWVMMTIRGVEVVLGDAASLMAISAMSLVCSNEVSDEGRSRVGGTHSKVMAIGVGLCLGLVSDENVDKGHDLVDLGLEELGDERCGEVHREGLSQVTRQHSSTVPESRDAPCRCQQRAERGSWPTRLRG
jgi:hypothetical protein